MNYVDSNLISGEKVVYKTGLHWSILLGSVLLGATLAIGALLLSIHVYSDRSTVPIGRSGVAGPSPVILAGVGILAILAAITIVSGIVRRNATEMAVTNKRVVIKTGVFGRRTVEVLLSKIESIGVDETFMGRMLGFGTVIIRGTGGTTDTFPKIAHPLVFRKQVQQQIEIYK